MGRFYKGFLSVLLALFIQDVDAQVVINEYSCANSTAAGFSDSFGEREDWVELYNTTTGAIDLNGYYISDKSGNPTKFQIPSSVVIPAGGYIMVFGSGRGIVAAGNQIHTNFKWTQTRYEKIILSDAGVNVLDSLTIIPNQHLHSRGRTTNGASTWSVFTNATPNSANLGAQQEYATVPSFNVAAGFYASTQSVTISSPDPNITIRYTVDGTEPNNTSPVYSTPINIAATTVLRARCFSSITSIPASFIETNTYFINSSHSIPVVSICGNDISGLINDTHPNAFTDAFPGAIEYFDENGVMQTEGAGNYDKHGNDSWAYPQRGVDFIMKDQYGYNYALKHQLFANKTRDKFQRIILKAGASDNYPFEGTPGANYAGELGGAHIRDPYVQALSQNGDLHLDERTYQSCILYMNGLYWGVYEIREKVDDSDFLDYYYGQDEQFADSPNYIQYLKTWGGTWQKYGAPNAQNDWNALLNYIQTNNMAIPANFNYVTSQYKWKSLVDYFVLNSYILNQDMLSWNTSWWRGLDTNGSKLKWRYSLWDMDATFNHYTNYTGIPSSSPNADPCNIDNLPNPGGQGHTVILNALMNNPVFEQYYISRYIDLSNTTFECGNMIAVLDSLVNIITPEMPGQIARWGGTMTQWQQNVQDMRNFINARCAGVSSGLGPCYNLTGPYPMQVNVTPVGAGDIQVNSITPTNYSYSGNYFGGVSILVTASENPGFIFDHWEVFNHAMDSAITNPSNSLMITQTDSVVAHYVLSGDTIEMTYDVDPVLGGDVSINGFTPTVYSHSQFYPNTSLQTLIPVPKPGHIFLNWSSNNTAFSPSPNDSVVTITVGVADTIIAHFEKIDTFAVVFNVDPVVGGNISIDGVTPAAYSHTENVIENTVLDLVATPQSGYLFSNWSSNNTAFIVNANSPTVQVLIDDADSIVAHFLPIDSFDIEFRVSPITMGRIDIDTNSVYDSFTTTSVIKKYITGTTVDLTETPISDFLFENWTSNNHVLTPSNTNSSVSFVASFDDVITANYVPEIPNFAGVPEAFSPNEDGANDVLLVYGNNIVSLIFDIYNRWGERVFSTSSKDNGWDGNYNGKKAVSGIYMYKLRAEFIDGESESKSGDITLVR
ncbi:MAG: CotH kinase family protein [Vicingaceae bacterium]|nr:CotH kinase family protein [Vicingaceae bacterium]